MICLCANTRRAARLLTQRYEEALRPAGLTPAQFELLVTLSYRPGISQSALASHLALDQTTLSRNLKPLLTRNLINHAACTRDRRQTVYTLTPIGAEALQHAMPLWQSAHQQTQHLLGDHWQPTLDALGHLNKLKSDPGAASRLP